MKEFLYQLEPYHHEESVCPIWLRYRCVHSDEKKQFWEKIRILSFGIVFILTKRADFIMGSLKIPIDNELYSIRVQESDGDIDSLFNGYFFLSDDSHTSSVEPNNKNQTSFDDRTDSSEDNSDDDHGGRNNGNETGGGFIPKTFSNAIPFMKSTGGDKNMAKATVGCYEEVSSSAIGYEVNDNNLSSMSDKAVGKPTAH
nr:hypothetical protein [Tanacetum cinerariifolium]